jgi:hypothetical protein
MIDSIYFILFLTFEVVSMEIFNTDNLDDKIHTMMLNGAKIWVRFFPEMSFSDFEKQLKKR